MQTYRLETLPLVWVGQKIKISSSNLYLAGVLKAISSFSLPDNTVHTSISVEIDGQEVEISGLSPLTVVSLADA